MAAKGVRLGRHNPVLSAMIEYIKQKGITLAPQPQELPRYPGYTFSVVEEEVRGNRDYRYALLCYEGSAAAVAHFDPQMEVMRRGVLTEYRFNMD